MAQTRRTLFVVGDRKQSIYSFQGADPDVFERVQAGIRQRLGEAGQALCAMWTSRSPSAPRPRSCRPSTRSSRPMPSARRGLDGASHARLACMNRTAAPSGAWSRSGRWSSRSTRRMADVWTAPVDREPAQSPRRRLAARAGRDHHGTGSAGASSPPRGRTVQPDDILVLVQKRNVLLRRDDPRTLPAQCAGGRCRPSEAGREHRGPGSHGAGGLLPHAGG